MFSVITTFAAKSARRVLIFNREFFVLVTITTLGNLIYLPTYLLFFVLIDLLFILCNKKVCKDPPTLEFAMDPQNVRDGPKW